MAGNGLNSFAWGRPGFDVWGWDRRRYKEYATTEYTIAKALELY
jgi:hypothetical protein